MLKASEVTVGQEVGVVRWHQHTLIFKTEGRVVNKNGHGHITVEYQRLVGPEQVVFDKNGRERTPYGGRSLVSIERYREIIGEQEQQRETNTAVAKVLEAIAGRRMGQGDYKISHDDKVLLLAAVEEIPCNK